KASRAKDAYDECLPIDEAIPTHVTQPPPRTLTRALPPPYFAAPDRTGSRDTIASVSAAVYGAVVRSCRQPLLPLQARDVPAREVRTPGTAFRPPKDGAADRRGEMGSDWSPPRVEVGKVWKRRICVTARRVGKVG